MKKGGEKSIEGGGGCGGGGGGLLCAMVTKTKATAFPYISFSPESQKKKSYESTTSNN